MHTVLIKMICILQWYMNAYGKARVLPSFVLQIKGNWKADLILGLSMDMTNSSPVQFKPFWSLYFLSGQSRTKGITNVEVIRQNQNCLQNDFYQTTKITFSAVDIFSRDSDAKYGPYPIVLYVYDRTWGKRNGRGFALRLALIYECVT